VIEVAFRPGVTDVPARELARGMVEIGLPACEVATAKRYEVQGNLSEADLRKLARGLLCNETVEHYTLGPIHPQFGQAAAASDRVETIPLSGLADDALAQVSRRRLLSLDRAEMRTIQEFYDELRRDPTDVELETLAQTWSEHCVHKTFRAQIDFTWQDAAGNVKQQTQVDGLLKQYIRAATEAINPTWLRSAFVDNAGIIAFDEQFDLAFKVETHNHPSALEPFGGANTGVGGVVRDIIGVSARPIANTNVLCFGPQDLPVEQVPAGMLHPQRIAEGVVDGIGDYVPQALGEISLHPSRFHEGTVVSIGDYVPQALGELTIDRTIEGAVLGEIGQMSEGRQGARALNSPGDLTIESFVDSGSLSGSVFD
jgi:phosphoribosylformylglycinamidine synthase